MADRDITSNQLGPTRVVLKAGQTISTGNHSIFQDIGTLKTYLHANGYTAARTAIMTKNDLVFAAREKLGLR